MPNWVHNTVKAENWEILKEKLTRPATDEEKQDLEDEGVLDVERVVDFNILIPQPKDLEVVAGGKYEWVETKHDYFGTKKELAQKQNIEIKPTLDKIYNENQTQDEFIAEVEKVLSIHLSKFIEVYQISEENEEDIKAKIFNILKGYYNRQKYGDINWYDWSLNNWGTKWNAHRSDVSEGYEEITFDTAWACPYEIFIELSKYTPVVVHYADEDTGCNYGILSFKNGEMERILDDSNESIGEALACEGYDIDYIPCYLEGYTSKEIKQYFKASSKKKLIEKLSKEYENASKIIKTLF